jgi:sugar lactone lactonase YvrE
MLDQNSVNRRAFLHALTAVASTPLLGNLAQGAAGEPAEAQTILGQGDFRYRVVPHWGELGAQTPVKDCHGMVQARDGRIFLLTNHTANNVIIYDQEGALLGKWGKEYPGAHGLTLFTEQGEERLFITDHDRHQVYKTTLDGKVLLTLDSPAGTPPYAKAEQYKPTHVAVAPDGGFYVADGYGLSHVLHYDAKGRLAKVFGGDTRGPDALVCAHGIHWDAREPGKPVLLVTSRAQNCIKRFTPAGEYVDTIALPGAQPCFMIPHGEYLVVPHLKGGRKPAGSPVENGFVSVLDRQNRVISNVAGEAPEYDGQGKLHAMAATGTVFTYPHGLLVDRQESIYVAQWNSGGTYPIKLERVKA